MCLCDSSRWPRRGRDTAGGRPDRCRPGGGRYGDEDDVAREVARGASRGRRAGSGCRCDEETAGRALRCASQAPGPQERADARATLHLRHPPRLQNPNPIRSTLRYRDGETDVRTGQKDAEPVPPADEEPLLQLFPEGSWIPLKRQVEFPEGELSSRSQLRSITHRHQVITLSAKESRSVAPPGPVTDQTPARSEAGDNPLTRVVARRSGAARLCSARRGRGHALRAHHSDDPAAVMEEGNATRAVGPVSPLGRVRPGDARRGHGLEVRQRYRIRSGGHRQALQDQRSEAFPGAAYPRSGEGDDVVDAGGVDARGGLAHVVVAATGSAAVGRVPQVVPAQATSPFAGP